MKNEKGFTLVEVAEVAMVITIIGIFAAIAIPKFNTMMSLLRAKDELVSQGIPNPTYEQASKHVKVMESRENSNQLGNLEVEKDSGNQSLERVFRVNRDYKFVDIKSGHADSYNKYLIITKKRLSSDHTTDEYKIDFIDWRYEKRETLRVIEE